jgi:hypothetical protein
MMVGTARAAGGIFRSGSPNAPYCVDAGRRSAYGGYKHAFHPIVWYCADGWSAVDGSVVNVP